MSVRSKWLFIFLGDNATGKTTIQKALVELIAGVQYQRLPSNNTYSITHKYLIRKFRKLFVAGRSYQELKAPTGDYATVEEYFRKLDLAGADVDLAFMGSHLDPADIEMMVEQAHRRFWNVCGIFFEQQHSVADPGQRRDLRPTMLGRTLACGERAYGG
jgi:hypothetical protein